MDDHDWQNFSRLNAETGNVCHWYEWQIATNIRQLYIAYFAHAVHSHPPFPADNAFSMGKKPPSRQ